MSDAIIVAIISGLITLFGVMLTNNKNQAVIETKLQNLTEEVKKHNNFASRIPVVEEKVSSLENRVSKLEGK